MSIEWPDALSRENSLQWRLAGGVISPGTSGLDGSPLVRTDGGGLWTATLTDVTIKTAAQVRLWRALAALLDNGAASIVLPLCDRRQMPAPLVNGRPVYTLPTVPHSDDALFDDGSGYRSNVITAKLSSTAALRSTSIKIEVDVGGDLQGGELFSILHQTIGWRLYVIGTAVKTSAGNFTCSIRPPLREGTARTTPVEFDKPRCVMRLAAEDGMKLPLDLRRTGQGSPSFVETFDS